MTILLVRHAQSAANVSDDVTRNVADHMVPLTDTGRAQATALGGYLREYFTTTHHTARLVCGVAPIYAQRKPCC
jgi:broad specificity phosphatase PhoE